MTAKEAITPVRKNIDANIMPGIGSEMPLLEVLPRLLDSPSRLLEVQEEGSVVGIIDERSLLEAFGRMIAPRDDSSVITVECAPADYSASSIAHAVEDVDVHLVDLLSVPGNEGRLTVTLRVRTADPTGVIASLERYGYNVTDAHGNWYGSEAAAIERLLQLQTLINV